MKFPGHNDNEGSQSEIMDTGIMDTSDTIDPDVMKGVFHPSMAKKTKSELAVLEIPSHVTCLF